MTADAGRRWTADDLHGLDAGAYVGYGDGIVARKRDDGGWMIFEDDRPGLKVPALEPGRVTGVVTGRVSGGVRVVPPAPRTDELRRRLSEAATTGIKPPLGVVPRVIWEDRRLAELDRAMTEYSAFGLPVDPAWQREHDELLAWRGQREPATLATMLAGRRAGKAAAGMEAAAAAIDELVRRSSVLGCGILLVGSTEAGAMLAYVDERIPTGQILEHPGDLPVGGVEALLGRLYPPAGPSADRAAPLLEDEAAGRVRRGGTTPSAYNGGRLSCGEAHPGSDVFHPEGHPRADEIVVRDV